MVSYQSLLVEARVLSQASRCGICGGQSGTATGFFLVLQFWPVIIIPPVLNTLSFIHSFIHSSIVDTVCSLQLTALLNNTLKILCGCCLYTVLLAIFLLGVTLQNIYCLNKECALF